MTRPDHRGALRPASGRSPSLLRERGREAARRKSYSALEKDAAALPVFIEDSFDSGCGLRTAEVAN